MVIYINNSHRGHEGLEKLIFHDFRDGLPSNSHKTANTLFVFLDTFQVQEKWGKFSNFQGFSKTCGHPV